MPELPIAALCAVLLAAPAALAQDPAVAKPPVPEDALVARARAIHERALTLDTHKDISPLLAPEQLPSDPETRERFRQQYDPAVRGSQKVDFPKMREGGLDCAFFIVYVGQGRNDPAGFKRAKDAAFAKFDAIDRMVRLYPEQIVLARTPDDVRHAVADGKLVACIGIENGYCMGEDLSLVETFWERGARYMSLTHNRHSQLGDSHTPAEPLHGGLTELGKKAIEEMNRVGIMVDVSHSSKQTMLDAIAHSKAPVIASHSGAYAVRAHGRNLDDEQLLALKENGGVIQVVALGSFLKDPTERDAAIAALREEFGLPQPRRGRGRGRGNRGGAAEAAAGPVENFEEKLAMFQERMKEIDAKFPAANVSDFVDHIDHAVEVIGIDHVGISSDFDGGGGIVGWNDASETFNVTLELVKRGYSEADIQKLWSGNTLRLWSDVERIAATLK